MRTAKKAPAEPKTVKFTSMKALKAAKSKGKAPRGLKADFSLITNELTCSIPGQDEPVLKVTLRNYVESALKADGIKLKNA